MIEIIFREPTQEELAEQEKSAAQAFEHERAYIEQVRRQSYQNISDPFFFGWQRGDNTKQEWLDAVQAIKDANPYPTK